MISLHHKPTKYVLRRFSLFALVLISVSVARAQTVPVGMPFFDDALHRAQLMGLVDSNVSFMIRPVQPGRALGIQNPNGLDTHLFPNDTNHYSYLGMQKRFCTYFKDNFFIFISTVCINGLGVAPYCLHWVGSSCILNQSRFTRISQIFSAAQVI